MDAVPSKIDLLIRSASSLVSIIDKQADQPVTLIKDYQTLRSLDRIALLLITKAKEEISAVSCVFGEYPENGCAFICVIDSPDGAEPPPQVRSYFY